MFTARRGDVSEFQIVLLRSEFEGKWLMSGLSVLFARLIGV